MACFVLQFDKETGDVSYALLMRFNKVVYDIRLFMDAFLVCGRAHTYVHTHAHAHTYTVHTHMQGIHTNCKRLFQPV